MPTRSRCLVAALCCVIPSLVKPQTLVQTGRYTAVQAVPTEAQKNPLQALVTVQFPEDVLTVGQAIRYVLSGTGYATTDVLGWDVEVFDLVNYPLPEIHRTLGPLTVVDVLETLVGPAFSVSVDLVHRRVGFERKPKPPQEELAEGEGGSDDRSVR